MSSCAPLWGGVSGKQPGWWSVSEARSEKLNHDLQWNSCCNVGRQNLLVCFYFCLIEYPLTRLMEQYIKYSKHIFFRLCFSLLSGIFFPQRLPSVLSFRKCFEAAVLRCLIYGIYKSLPIYCLWCIPYWMSPLGAHHKPIDHTSSFLHISFSIIWHLTFFYFLHNC